MLEDIPNPFNQIVNRPPRPSHSRGRSSSEDLAARRRIVPIPASADPTDAAEALEAHAPTREAIPMARITTAPGPREVSSPSWWNKKPLHYS
jgi:hypothetical protein